MYAKNRTTWKNTERNNVTDTRRLTIFMQLFWLKVLEKSVYIACPIIWTACGCRLWRRTKSSLARTTHAAPSDVGLNITWSKYQLPQMDPCDRLPHAHCVTNRAGHTHNTHTHTLFNGPFSGTTQVSQYQKGKTDLDFTEARDSEWQWHQLGHMQVCTLLQTENHASTPPLCFLQAGCPSCRPTNSVKALKATHS